jgi:hypothetical protein
MGLLCFARQLARTQVPRALRIMMRGQFFLHANILLTNMGYHFLTATLRPVSCKNALPTQNTSPAIVPPASGDRPGAAAR